MVRDATRLPELCELRILVYGINYSPELTGIGKFTGEMVEWLASRGHEVRVVTAPPYYPAWKIDDRYSPTRYTTETLAGAKVYRCPLWVPQKHDGFRRVAHLLSFALSSLPVMLSQIVWRPKLVFTVEPAFLCAPTALLVSKITSAAAWLHVQDFEVDAAFDLGILPAHGLIHWLALALEGFFTRRFDRVSSISPNMLRRSLAKGVPEKHTLLFPNWVDTDSIQPMPHGASPYRKELGLTNDDILLLYSGNMGMKQGLEILPMLARNLAPDRQVKFLFCGDGAFRPQLEQMVKGLGNIAMLPLQPAERLNDLLNAADIHLLPQRADAANLVMPSKLTGILASGRPVITTAAPGTQVARVVESCGIAVPADDADAVCGAVRKLVDDSALRCRLGRAARAYAVEHMGREQVLRRFSRQMEDVAAHHPDALPADLYRGEC